MANGYWDMAGCMGHLAWPRGMQSSFHMSWMEPKAEPLGSTFVVIKTIRHSYPFNLNICDLNSTLC
ncbi:hypothetical protein M413DRAFT_449316 [Hebeloma cylindrosporum]|uniref:Uncharacterized protein n=1 Tax=Hebeloma cylindrosporum TaxID=76867 RepID=A0A0C2XED2_HEBCY|nr:hypothetical protein M413DRAFT_449316 [Hebeloma cylindrosporum h7]